MLRHILTAGALLVPAVAFAQNPSVEMCETPVHAGRYVVATGELIPPGAKGTEVNTQAIYSNTCSSGFFFGSADTVIFDDGRVPSVSSPAPAKGDRNTYYVTGYQIAYCSREVDPDLGGAGATVNIFIWEDYDDCDDIAGAGTPTSGIQLTGLPASDGTGALACYTIDIDLTGSGLEFCMKGDADGVYDGDDTLDGFGYAYQMVGADPALGSAGPIIAGDPNFCAVGDGTFYQNPGATDTSGLGNDDLFFQDPGGCFFFGGAPWAAFHFVLYADLDDCACGDDCNGNGVGDHCDIASGFSLDVNDDGIPDECQPGAGTPYCFGTGCPCGNDDPTAGCLNSTGLGGLLYSTGGDSVGAGDTGMIATHLPPKSVGLFVMGDAQASGGAGITLYDGLLCVAGTTRRFPVTFIGPDGTASLLDPANLYSNFIVPGSTWNFQCWYRDSNGSPCSNNANLTNAVSIDFVQ
jgi:hypothetical protein